MRTTADEHAGSDRPLVVIRPCDDYDRDRLCAAVREGMNRFPDVLDRMKGARVLLKPNMVGSADPSRAVTTHPEVLRAVIEVVSGYASEIVVGDSPGYEPFLHVAERSGVAAVCRETGVRLGSFEDYVDLQFTAGRVCRKFTVAKEVAEADVIINLPKLKTHTLTVMTGAVKNMFGCVSGLRKAQFHVRMQDVQSFAGMLVDLCGLLAPALNVMDAIVGMEGDGPRHGDPRQIGLVLVSADAFAVDLVASSILGFRPDEVPTIAAARRAGVGPMDASNVRLEGPGIASVVVRDFRRPRPRRGFDSLPGPIRRLSARVLAAQPVVVPSLCRRCSICADVCPARAVRAGTGVMCIDRLKCIHCYCCQEMCPHGAIVLRKGMLARIMEGRLLTPGRRNDEG